MDRERLALLFDAAVELPDDERPAWLARECAGDDALRAALERLLAADRRAGHFLDEPPRLLARAAATPPDEAPRHFGPWRTLRLLGSGGMGEVWLAERSDAGFVQRAAVKQLAWPTPGLLERFGRERQILAALEHPAIARLIDGGVDAAGSPYLVMEYVEGEPVTDYAERRALDLRARLDLVVRVCDAVHYAHQNLIVHRDLKPSNILVGADGTVKLLDFGIAKVLAATGAPDATHTASRLMTPQYAAPEQFSGAAVTTAVDVYALGVVLYELLTGTRPPLAAAPVPGMPETAAVPPPSSQLPRTDRAAAARRRALRGDLDRIVLTALATDPQRRYPSAAALAADIGRHLRGEPIAAQRDSALYRAGKFVRRHRVGVAAALVAFALLAAATASSLRQARLALAAAARAEQQSAQAERQGARAAALRDFVTGVFNQANPDENQGQAFTAADLLQRGQHQLEAMGGSADLRLDVTALLARLYLDTGDYARAQALYEAAESGLGAEGVADPVRARVLTGHAALLVDRRDFPAAIERAERALARARAAGSEGVAEASAARHQINRALLWKRDTARAERELRETLAADRAAFGEHHASVAEDWHMLGMATDELARYDESTRAFEHAVALLEELNGAGHSSVSDALNDFGIMLMHKGDLDRAEAVLGRALAICTRLFGEDDDNTRSVRSNLWRVLEYEGRFADVLPQRLAMLAVERAKQGAASRPDQMAFALNLISVDQRELGLLDAAERSVRESLALWRTVEGSHRGAGSSAPLQNLGETLLLTGRAAEAESVFRQALAIELASQGPAGQWSNVARARVGRALDLQGHHAEAVAELAGAATALGRITAGGSAWSALAAAQLAEAQLAAGNALQASATAEAALEVARRTLPPGNLRLGVPLVALARARLALERPADAESLLREALAVRRPPYPSGDPRVGEVLALLRESQQAQGRGDAVAPLHGAR